jgi:uncharacterized protein YndB with AHSA1/START domain
MFNLFRRRNGAQAVAVEPEMNASVEETSIDAPYEFSAEVEIEAPIERVFELLDFGAEGNALRERGFRIVDITDTPQGFQRFTGLDPDMPTIIFTFTVEHYQAPYAIAFKTTFSNQEKLGGLRDSRSVYVLSDLGDGMVRVQQTELARFREELTEDELSMEHSLMGIAIYNDLAKLKLHAEIGPEAATLS